MRAMMVSGLLAIGAAGSSLAADVRTGPDAFANWHNDAPGVQRRITPQDLEPPKQNTKAEEPDFKNNSTVVAPPSGALPKVPPGFTVEVFATGLGKPRTIRTAPNGDIFVAESGGGRILVFKNGTNNPIVFAGGLQKPYGIAFYPAGPTPQFIYIGETNQIVRFPYTVGDVKVRGAKEVIVPNLPTNRHWTRDVVTTSDGRLFYSIGSGSNIGGDDMPAQPNGGDVRAYEATHGLGAAWGAEENRAMVRTFSPDGKNVKTFATGLRNCSGMAVQPETDMPWCVVNERDHLGDNVPTEYATHLTEGAFYGWPWYYIGNHEEPRLHGRRPDLNGHVTTPDVLMEAHTAPLGVVFYEGTQFPAQYKGSAFVALHGSWNRTSRTGYKVVRLPMANGKPTGVEEDFMTGFVLNDKDVWGRPVGVGVAADGSLLVSEDGNGTIFRVSFIGK